MINTPAPHSITPDQKTSSKATLWILVAACLVAATIAVRLFSLAHYDLWLDEVFSSQTAQLSWSGLFQGTIDDGVHPPLFYALLKVWMAIGGTSVAWLRTLPLIFAIGSIWPLFLLCRHLSVRLPGFCVTLSLIAPNAYLIVYATELRMYSMLAFLSLWSICLFAGLARNIWTSKTTWLLLFAVNLLMVLTHYFGWFTVVAEVLVALLYCRRLVRPMIIQTFVLGMSFLPWCLLVVTAVDKKGGLGSNLGWIDKPGLSAIPLFLADLHGNPGIRYATTLGLVIFATPLLLWLRQLYRDRTPQDAFTFLLLSLATAVPVLFTFSASYLLSNSIWVERYFIAAAFSYILLVSVAVTRLHSSLVRTIFLPLMVIWAMGAGLWSFWHRPAPVSWTGFAQRIHLSADAARPPLRIFSFEEWTRRPLSYALDPADLESSNVERVNSVSEIADDEFWLVYREKGRGQTNVEPQANGCTIREQMLDGSGGGVVHLVRLNCRRDSQPSI